LRATINEARCVDRLQALEETQVVEKDPEKPQHRQLAELLEAGAHRGNAGERHE
jgi:hypothetical protein